MTKEELAKLGINVDDLKYPMGEMNIIVQCFPQDKDEDGNIVRELFPDVYHPRKNSVWSCGCSGDGFSVESPEEIDDYISHLKDSVGRLRILALLLEKQAKELETIGYVKTKCYYPDLEEIGYLNESK